MIRRMIPCMMAGCVLISSLPAVTVSADNVEFYLVSKD